MTPLGGLCRGTFNALETAGIFKDKAQNSLGGLAVKEHYSLTVCRS